MSDSGSSRSRLALYRRIFGSLPFVVDVLAKPGAEDTSFWKLSALCMRCSNVFDGSRSCSRGGGVISLVLLTVDCIVVHRR